MAATKKPRFAIIHEGLMRSTQFQTLNAPAVKVMLAIALHADPKGIARPSVDTIAKVAGLDKRRAERAIKTCVDSGVLRREQGGGRGRTTVYRIPQNPVSTDRGLAVETPSKTTALYGYETPSIETGVNRPKPRSPVTDQQHPIGQCSSVQGKTAGSSSALTDLDIDEALGKEENKNPPTHPSSSVSGGRAIIDSAVVKLLRAEGVSRKVSEELAAQTEPVITTAVVKAVIADVSGAGGGAGLIVHRLRAGEFKQPSMPDVYALSVAEQERLKAKAIAADPDLRGMAIGMDAMRGAINRIRASEAVKRSTPAARDENGCSTCGPVSVAYATEMLGEDF